MCRLIATGIAIMIFGAASAYADTITLDAIGKGSYVYRKSAGTESWAPSDALWAQVDTGGFIEQRTWLAFDLSGLAGSIQSASLTMRTGNLVVTLDSTPNEPQQLLQYRLFSTATLAATLLAKDGDAKSIFADLGDGTILGGHDFIPNVENNSTVDLAVNADGLLALQSSLGGGFVLGGTLPLIPFRWPVVEFDDSFTPQLTITTPEPPSILLVSLALLGIRVRRSRTTSTQ